MGNDIQQPSPTASALETIQTQPSLAPPASDTQMPPNMASQSSTEPNDLAHVTQEIYKKNLQLAETNKLLSLLRSIDEIILGSVNDATQIANQVVRLVVDVAGFRGMMLMLRDREHGGLFPVAIGQNAEDDNQQVTIASCLSGLMIMPDAEENLVNQAVMQHQRKTSSRLSDLLVRAKDATNIDVVQQTLKIKTVIAYPLTIRGQNLGAMILLLKEDREDVSAFKKDIISRLSSVIGIALDNALLYQQIQNANEKLKELDRLKDDFVSVASHELRTPMTAIKSYVWMLLNNKTGNLQPKQREYLEHTYVSVNRLINLVNEMLNISRIESGRMDMNIQKGDLTKLVDEVILEVAPRAAELEIGITVVKRALPAVLVDGDKIKEVLINLIGNSLKFTPKGGLIKISFEVGDDMVVVRVADNGVGIAQEDQAVLFQKFGFVGTSYKVNKSDAKGSGLGLYISRAIINMHKGKMTAFSEGQNRGSVFSFSVMIYSDEEFAAFQKEYGEREKTGLGVIHSNI